MTERTAFDRELRRGCCILPTLFSTYIQEIVNMCFSNEVGVKIDRRNIKCIRFGNDMCVFLHMKPLNNMFKELERSCENKCKENEWNGNWNKEFTANIKISRENVEQVFNFQLSRI